MAGIRIQAHSWCRSVPVCRPLRTPAALGSSRQFSRPRNPVLRRCCSSDSSTNSMTDMILAPLTRRLQGVPGDTLAGQIYNVLLPGPLAYTPALLMPMSCLLAAYGSIYGPHWLDALASFAMGFENEGIRSIIKQHWAGQELLRTGVSLTFASLGALADFIAVPALDVVLGRDLSADDKERAKMLVEDPTYRLVLHAFAVLHCIALLVTCQVAGTHHLHPLVFVGLVASQSAAGGVMMTVVHELVHSRHRGDNQLAALLLSTVGYMHWQLGHMAHHLNVGKFDDPATARRGETMYHFVPRSMVGHLRDASGMERQRLRAKSIPLWSPHNKMVWWLACPLALAAAVYSAWGPAALLMLAWQAAGSVFLLEVVNYLEHYGLEREQLPSGRFERVQAKHSWNANWIATSALTFRLQRHADHHLAAGRPYQALQDNDEAPQLPASYPAMAMVSLLPGLFFSIMHPRLDDYQAAMAAGEPANADIPPDTDATT